MYLGQIHKKVSTKFIKNIYIHAVNGLANTINKEIRKS